jgi:predicted Fe-Mo cluster-binding NifX family protein
VNSNLKVKIDGVEKDIQHNFVQDGLDQLKNYYTSVNDVKNLEKIKNYIEKGGETGAGLTIKDVNDIAKMHSKDLNAFNASGELASGLKKQAAENTRMGIKKIVRELGPKGSEVIDKKITDVYTVKDLSEKMEDAVNKLSQRLQNPNIFRKLGGLVGKATRVTGIGDFASKLLGIDKMPGANILSPVELEAQLSKNLKKINAALGKDDAGFINDMQEFSKELKSSI